MTITEAAWVSESTVTLWDTWARAALSARDRACAARQDGDISREMADALTAMCASTFAAESLTFALAQLTMPKDTVRLWKSNGRGTPTAAQRLKLVLRRCIAAPRSEIDGLADRWQPAITKRNDAVHFWQKTTRGDGKTTSALQLHPSGVRSSAEAA